MKIENYALSHLDHWRNVPVSPSLKFSSDWSGEFLSKY